MKITCKYQVLFGQVQVQVLCHFHAPSKASTHKYVLKYKYQVQVLYLTQNPDIYLATYIYKKLTVTELLKDIKSGSRFVIFVEKPIVYAITIFSKKLILSVSIILIAQS